MNQEEKREMQAKFEDLVSIERFHKKRKLAKNSIKIASADLKETNEKAYNWANNVITKLNVLIDGDIEKAKEYATLKDVQDFISTSCDIISYNIYFHEGCEFIQKRQYEKGLDFLSNALKHSSPQVKYYLGLASMGYIKNHTAQLEAEVKYDEATKLIDNFITKVKPSEKSKIKLLNLKAEILSHFFNHLYTEEICSQGDQAEQLIYKKLSLCLDIYEYSSDKSSELAKTGAHNFCILLYSGINKNAFSNYSKFEDFMNTHSNILESMDQSIKTNIGDELTKLGLKYFELGEFNFAIKIYQKILNLLSQEDMNREKIYFNIFNSMGNIARGHVDSKNYLDALKIFQEMQDLPYSDLPLLKQNILRVYAFWALDQEDQVEVPDKILALKESLRLISPEFKLDVLTHLNKIWEKVLNKKGSINWFDELGAEQQRSEHEQNVEDLASEGSDTILEEALADMLLGASES